MSATKSLRHFILFSLLGFLVPFTAFAAETDHTWSLSGTLGGPGSTNYINLAVENAVDFETFGIEFYWGTTVLEPASATSGSEGYNFERLERIPPKDTKMNLLGSLLGSPPSGIRLAMYPTGETTPPLAAGSGDILKFVVKVKSDASPGDTVTVYVNVGRSTTVLATLLLEVTESAGPEFVDPGTQAVNLDDTLRFTLSVADPTMTDLVYRMETPPGAGATLDSLTGEFLWVPAAGGDYHAIFSVLYAGQSDSLNVLIRVNTPPVLADLEPRVIGLGETLQFTLQAEDADLDELVFSKSAQVPETLTLDSLTGEVSWTAGTAGAYELVFYVSDGIGQDSTVVAVTVNTPPTIVAPDTVFGKTDQELTFTLEGADEDGDEVTFHMVPPSFEGAVLDSLTGVFTWVPSEEDIFSVKVYSFDGYLGSDTSTVVLLVEQGVLELSIEYPASGAGFEATEGQPFRLVFLVDNPADSLYLEATGLPSGAAFINDTTLQWTPGQADAGQYPVTVTYSNETGGADAVELTITVAAVNAKPVWPILADTLRAREGQLFSYTFSPPQDLDPDDEVFVSVSNAPQGSQFNEATLTLTWEPGYDKAGVYRFGLVATDLDGARAVQMVNLVVSNTNRPPMLLLTGEVIEIGDEDELVFTVGVFDPDGDRVAIKATGDPAGWKFSDPAFTWDSPVEGEHVVIFTATDAGGLKDTFELTILVTGVNDPPEFELVPDKNVEAGEQVSFEVKADDPDGDELVYSMVVTGTNNLQSRGAEFSGNTFTWTPAASDIGLNVATFAAKDPEGEEAGLEVTIRVTVSGREVLLPPQLDVAYYAAPLVIEEGGELVFELMSSLTEPGREGLSFWCRDLPKGAAFDSVAAVLTWTPTLRQAGTYKVTCGVTDGNFPSTKTLTIKVTEKDVPPVLAPVGDKTVYENELLKFNLSAVDASGEPVTFEADGLPDNADIYSQGLFSWRPTYDQEDEYEVTFYAIDASGNTDEETVTLTVLNVNREPELVVSNQTVVEGGHLQFDIIATDQDGDEVSYDASDLPDGASFDSDTRLFDWTPTQTQSGNYIVLFTASDGKAGGVDSARVVITVGDVNRPPEIVPLGDQSVEEGSSLSFEVGASDPDESDQLSLELSGVPQAWISLTFDPANPLAAMVEAAPGYLDAGIYDVRVTVTDNNPESPLSVSRSFKLQVMDKDVPPAFTGQLAGTDTLRLSVDEGGKLEIEVSAQDPGGDALSYSTSALPKNATADFTGARKLITFSPSYKQSGERRFSVVVSDGIQAVVKPVKVTVKEVNLPPIVFEIDDQSVNEGDIITFAVNNRDPDGDSVNVFTAGRVPFLTEGDPAPASIRDGKVFVFDTALLPEEEQISSAVFLFWAVDVRGGVSDSVRVEIAVVRRDSVETPELASGDEDDFLPPGFGLKTKFKNNSGQALHWLFKFLEKSGFLENAGLPELASAGDGKVKAEKGVYTYLAGDDLTSQFYGIRRGWGLDLSSQEPVEGADVEVTLSYFDEDLPTEVPNFTEARLSVFGFDPGLGTWVKMEGVAVDTLANEATFTVTDYSIVDYTVGAVVDVVAPVITGLKVVAGDFTVVPTGVDTTYDLKGPYVFKMNITDDEVVSSTDAMLYYSVGGGAFEEAALTRSSGNLFTAQVSGPLSAGSSIRYYVVARDNMNEVSLPSGAPAEAYELVVVEYTAVPGDVDESGAINIFDLLNLLQVLSGGRDPSPGSDVNRDGSTNIFDLLALLGFLAG